MWEQYEKHKGIRRQLDKVKPGKKEAFEQKYGTELALYEAAARYLEKLKSGGETVTPEEVESRIGKTGGTEGNPLSGNAHHEGADQSGGEPAQSRRPA
ncbi:MAG: hypothetical protein OSJ69_23170 [Acetatifactor sp.]|nr:hypothetical protein [Acetatifactor sp.]